mgnify:CR=1 FL=1
MNIKKIIGRQKIVKYKGNVIFNRPRSLIENLDELPPPDRELMYEADPDLRNTKDKFFLSTRGCPYYCTYCFNSKYNKMYEGLGLGLRHRSVSNLIDEIYEVRYSLRLFHMIDDTFLLKPKGWFEEFSKSYCKRAGLPFSCNVRPNVVGEEIMGLLKEAGLYLVSMGCECGDEEISNRILKRNISNKQILNAASIIKKAGIILVTQNLCGVPVSNSYDVNVKTLELNFSINPAFAFSSILYPYPGTPIEVYARDNNYLEDKAQSLHTNKYMRSLFNFSSGLEKRKIENLHKLFDLLVCFRWLRPYRDLLCRLPLTRFYLAIFYLRCGYQANFKLYPLRFAHRKLLPYVKLFFKLLSKD